jgi:choline dehydrogenase
MQQKNYDYIIVGAGSAGCVLAHRLTEDPEVTVLLLETGPWDNRFSWRLHMPAALAYPLMDRTYNWGYESEPEPDMNGRRMYCPRGRVLGGSSSINGMVYIRGHARDYDRWAQAKGMEGWSYAHVLPYFKKAETRAQGPDDYRGGEGPLGVATGACRNPLSQAFIEAAQQAGYAFTDDVNGYRQEGIGPYDMTVRQGRRSSAARAYLHPVLGRANLTVETRAFTTRVMIDGGRAVGLEYEQLGLVHQPRAEREVILSTGAINTPQLLMLSGIGPADHLKEMGLEVLSDLPGVGQNLQDHLEIYVQQESLKPVSLYPAMKPWNQLVIGARWLFLREGIGASNQFEAGGFIRSRAGVEHPDLQYHFLPIAMHYDGSRSQNVHGYQAHIGPMRPTSSGRVSLKSADPRDPPTIRFNYMGSAQDRQEMRDGIKLTREIFAQEAFTPFRGRELAPGPEVRSDADIDAFVRAESESAYHPSCTCKMGADKMAVVDAQGRVHGLEGLRVVDASIMPSIVSGNLNAPTIMMAEKMADVIRGRDALPALDTPVFIHPEWETEQR